MRFDKNKSRNLKRSILIWLIVLIVVIGFFFYFSECILRPVLNEYSINQAKIYTQKIINEAVNELFGSSSYEYSDIAVITRDVNSQVSSIEIDTIKINALKSSISNAVYNKLNAFNEFSIKIPIGTLTSNKYLIGRGPKITFKMQLSAFANADFESKFFDAGINQTLHQILINVDCKTYIIMPPYNTNCDVSTSFIAAQSVIVGTVPEAYTSVFEGEPSDITDAIFDYADSVSYSDFN